MENQLKTSFYKLFLILIVFYFINFLFCCEPDDQPDPTLVPTQMPTPTPAPTQIPTPTAPIKMIESDTSCYGVHVAINGNRIGICESQSHVFMYQLDGFTPTLIQTLNSPANSSFASSISIKGNYMIVGAREEVPSSGAYIYRWNGINWILDSSKLTPSDAPVSRFAHTVSIDTDYAIVGAFQGDGSTLGSAYIYFNDPIDGWIEQRKLTASDGEVGDDFGSVSIDGDYALVGASWDDNINGTNAGSVYIFNRNEGGDNNWGEVCKLLGSQPGDRFGNRVDISGNYAIVGAVGKESYTGEVYVFHNEEGLWTQMGNPLLANNPTPDDYFGISVSINDSGDFAVIGAAYKDDNINGGNAGAAYLFMWDGNNWIQMGEKYKSDTPGTDYYGISVSISGSLALIGSYYDDGGAGAAFLINIP